MITESIYSSDCFVIPMAEVSHIEKKALYDGTAGIEIVFKHSKWQTEQAFGQWSPKIYLDGEEMEKFLRSWCTYRAELDMADSKKEGGDNDQ